MSDAPFRAIIIFGPHAAEVAAEYRAPEATEATEAAEEAEAFEVYEAADPGGLDLPAFSDARITLLFAHRVPARWSSESRFDAWLRALVGELGIGRVAMGFPDLRGVGYADRETALLMLNWFGVSTETVLTVARAIDASYATFDLT